MISSLISITGSVGRRGQNAAADVRLIQARLNALAGAARSALVIDGIAGPKTTATIAEFQRLVVGVLDPDARADPDGRTIGALNDPASAAIWQRRCLQQAAAASTDHAPAGVSPGAAPLPAMPTPCAREGEAAPGMNFAGRGWAETYRMRPTCSFDFAAKIHDLHYVVNGSSFSFTRPEDPVAASRRARADLIFHIMNDHRPTSGTAGLYDWLARSIFRPQAEIMEHDGFINVLAEPQYLTRLNRPHDYLMIPYEDLPAAERPVHAPVAEGRWMPRARTAPDYHATVPADTTPGFLAWYEATYAPVAERIRTMQGFVL